MSSSDQILGQNSQDVFAKPFLQDASLLDGVVSLGIQSTQPNTGLAAATPTLTPITPTPADVIIGKSVAPGLLLPPLANSTAATVPIGGSSNTIDPLTGNRSITPAAATTAAPTPIPTFSIVAEGRVTANGNSDFDGVANDLTDDVFIYAGNGFNLNGNTELATQRNANGSAIVDSQGRSILRPYAVSVGPNAGASSVNGSNRYAGLIPPPVAPQQTVTVPDYAILRQQELDRRIPAGTATVTFDARQNSLKNAQDWTRLFPASGTATQPRVVRVINGSLNIPNNVTFSNMVIIVENGNISIGNNQALDSVVLVANAGTIDLGSVQAKNLSALASGGITMSGGSRFDGTTLIANNSGDISFNGATKTFDATQYLRVVSQGAISYNGATNTRGNFIAKQNFTFNGTSSLYGAIHAKGDITFNGRSSVVAIDQIAPTITARLERDTAPSSTTNTDRLTFDATIVGQVSDNILVAQFKAGLDAMTPANFVNILPQRQADGSFRLTRSQLEQINGGTLVDGVHTLKLQAIDQAGNASAIFELTFTLDTKAPTISSPDLMAVSDSGRSNTDNLTNTSRPKLEGTAEAGAIVRLYQNNQLIGQAIATDTGVWAFQVAPLNDGQYRFTTTAEDAAGNVSLPSTALLVTIDTKIDAPINLDLIPPSDSGQSNQDDITNQTSPIIAGQAEAGTIVKLYRDTVLIGETTTDANGRWQVATIALSNGTHRLTATATDAAGNVSSASSLLTIVVDSVQPTLSLMTSTATPITQVSKLAGSMNGTGSAIASALYFFDGGVERSMVLDAAGRFDQVFDLTGVANGNRILTIVTTDAAGNVRTTQLNVVVAVDTEAPIITATLVRDTAPDNQTNQDVITFDPTIAGTVRDANLIVEFQARFSNTAQWINVLAQRQADSSFSLSRSQLNLIYGSTVPDGTYRLQLQAKDEFGNVRVFGLGFTLDTIVEAPINLQLTASSDTGSSATDRITRIPTPTITGLAEPKARVQLFEGTTLIGQVTATDRGTWQITTSALANGVHTLMAIATDIAGNVSVPSQAFVVTVDAVLPTLRLNQAIDVAPLINGARLSGSINGTGSAIAQIEYRWGAGQSITISADAAGRFDQALNFVGIENGLHILTITAADVAGNVSTNTFNVTVALDFDAPLGTATLLNDTARGGTTNRDRITSDPTIVGTLSDASPIVAFRASVNDPNPSVNVLAAINPQGRFTLDRARLEQILGGALSDGAYTVYLQAVDQYNNVSQIFEVRFVLDTSLRLTVVLDPAFDSTPVGDSQTIASVVSLSGQAEAGAIVKLVQTGTTAVPSELRSALIADASGRFVFENVALALGDNAFTFEAEDVAGNRSTTPLLIKRLDTNQAPTDILLSRDTIPENSAAGTLIGTLNTIDPDTGDAHQYTLVDSANGRFQLIGNELRVAPGAILDYETATSYTIKVRTTDNGKPNLFFDKALTVRLSNVNERPVFTSTPVINAEAEQPYTYTIATADPENGTRAISANNLPSWLTLNDNGDGTATLTGTPSGNQAGLYSIDLTVTDIGGLTSTQTYLLGVDLVLREGSRFRTSQSVSFTIDRPGLLSFTIAPSFDTAKNFINDAFEVALVDARGRSLVPAISVDREVFFNWTEGESAALGSGTTYNSATKTVTLNLTGIPKNTEATLVFRLVNDDQDTETQVRIRELRLIDAPAGTLPPVIGYGGATNSISSVVPNFNVLEDVSSSMTVEYDQTSHDAAKKLLYAKIAIKSSGTYSVDVPLLVAVSHLSDPSVLVRNPDGFTPEGLPYYDFSHLVVDGKFDPSELSGDRSLVFYNPNGVQFTYGLVVLAQLNQKPVIESEPTRETIAGKPYRYAVQASDPNHDVLSYRLLSAPLGMTISAQTGVINWTPAANAQSSHAILVQVSDGHDGIAEQNFTLAVTVAPPNRPPMITSTPVVDLQIGSAGAYRYDVQALDADQDNLTYSLVSAPDGMRIDPMSGVIRWLPNTAQIGVNPVTVQVNDGRGGTAEQSFKILVRSEAGNRAPIFISEAKTTAYSSTSYIYEALAIDADQDILSYSLSSAPSGMIIDSATGKISWSNPIAGTHSLGVKVIDGRGGTDSQHFHIDVSSVSPGRLQGTVYLDLDANGTRGKSGSLGTSDPTIPVASQYQGLYATYNLGSPLGVPARLGGLTFKYDDPNTILLGGSANTNSGKLYALKVIRGEGDHIVGFEGSATIFADGQYNDGGVVYSPDNVLFYARWPINEVGQLLPGQTSPSKITSMAQFGVPGSTAALTFVPEDYPGAGQFKLVTWSGGQFYTIGLSQDSQGTYDINSAKLETVIGGGPEGLTYIPLGSPLFNTPTLLVAEWSASKVAAYDVDGSGNPIVSSRRDFISNLPGAEGAVIDPLTGDFILSTFGGGDRLVSVRGFAPVQPSDPGLKNWIVYLDQNGNDLRDSDETYTLTDSKGNYVFDLLPRSYRVAVEKQPGWLQTAPPAKVHSVNLESAQTIARLDFGQTNSRIKGAENLAPTFTSVPTRTAVSSEPFVYRATATDLNADDLVFDLIVKPVGMTISPNGVLAWRPAFDQVGIHDVIVRVKDGRGGVDLQSFQVSVKPGNRAPIITSTVPNIPPQVGKEFRYPVKAVDVDGDAIRYELVQGITPLTSLTPSTASIDPVTGILTWSPAFDEGRSPGYYPQTGELAPWQFTIRAIDGRGGEAYQTVEYFLEPAQLNRAPVITSGSRSTVRPGSPYFYKLEASDPDGDPLTYSLTSAPSGMTLQDGILTWTPLASQTGTQIVEVQVSDGALTALQRYELDVVSQVINQAPVISSAPNQFTNLERLYEYNPTGRDPDGDIIFWTLEQAPDGMVIDASTGKLRWQPRLDQVDNHHIVVRLTDDSGAYTTQEFTLVVTGTNAPPKILSVPVTRAGLNQRYTYVVTASDPENSLLTYQLGRCPDGMTINAQTGKISWTPTFDQIRSHTIDVRVTDAQGAATTQTFDIVVETTAINQAPNITSTPVFMATPQTGYRYEVKASDPDGNPLTYNLLKAPPGMTISAAGVVSWNQPLNGTYDVIVGVEDGSTGSAQGFNLTVRSNRAPEIRSVAPTIATLGTAYRYDVQAIDADGDSLTYRLDVASMSRGMTIDDLGRIVWTPTAAQAGQHPVIITVTDAQGATVQEQVQLQVERDTIAPKVQLFASQTAGDPGGEVTLYARATDNTRVADLALTINGARMILDANGQARVKLGNAGTQLVAIASAVDAAGNQGFSEQIKIDSIDSTAAFDPVFGLNLGNLADEFMTSRTAIRGSVGGEGFARYELSIAPMDSDQFKTIATGTTAIQDGTLGTLDPSLLQNDAYTLRLTVYGTNGSATYTEETVNVAGELKLGNFRLSFTDLAIPVTGIPISLTRTYDTLTSNQSDDFGYGWRMEFRDSDLRTSLGRRSEEEELLDRYPAFDDRTKVFITLPGGKREAFSFKAKAVEQIDGLPLGPFTKYFYEPTFASEKGSTSKLTIESKAFFTVGANGKYYGFQGQPFNPADALFGGVYVLTTKDGTQYRIDAKTGDLLTVKDTNGNTLTYTDDAISSSTGQKVTFERDAQNRIVSVKDPTQEYIRYGYDANGDLVSVTDREKNVTRMVYDTSYDDPNYANDATTIDPTRTKRSHFLREIIDPLNRTGARSEYDENGRLKQIVDANGKAVEMTYDINNDRQVVKDQLGNQTIYVYDDRGNIIQELDAVGKLTKRAFDAKNNLLSETFITLETGATGYTTSYTYDDRGNQLTRTNAIGETDIYTYNSRGQLLTNTNALGHTTTYTYDGSGNVLSKRDATGNLTNYTYYSNGLNKTIVEGANRDGVQDVTYFEYDRFGNRTLKRDALGNETTYVYDGSGNVLTETYKLTTATGIRTLTTTKSYDKSGKVKTLLDAKGGLTTYTYDANGNQTKVVNALGQTTWMVYDDKNQLLETILDDDTPTTLADNPRLKNEFDLLGNKTTIVDEKGRRTIYSYDALKRPTGMVLPDGTPLDNSDNSQVGVIYNTLGWMTKLVKDGITTEFEYDKAGRIIRTWVTQNGQRQETSSVYDQAGRAIAKTDALGRTTRYVYDDLDRLTETIYSDGKSDKTVYNYAGKEIAKVDRAGRTTKYEYDVLDRLTGVEDALNYRMEYGYDEVGNLVQQKDANQQMTRYEYDELNRRTATIRPLGQRSRTIYDAIGRVKETKDFNGAVIQYGYDEENRLTSKQFVNEGSRIETYTTAEDARSRSVVDARGTTSYTYDEQGRMLSKIEPDGKQISYTYDIVTGKVASVATPSGTTQYRYNSLGQLAKVIAAESETTYEYNAIGNLKTKTLPNGIIESYTYDSLNRLHILEQRNTAGVIASYIYTYDLVGNKTKVEELGGRSVSYTYDALYRLTKEAIVDPVRGDRTIEYVYDAVGNRLTKKDRSIGDTIYRYNQNDWLLDEKLNGTTTSYTYDANGNTKTKTTGAESMTYVWDTQNRLTNATITSSGQTQQLGYEYNVEGVRTKTIVDGVETRYLLDENRQYAQVLEEYEGAGVRSHYIYGAELDLIAQTRGGAAAFFLEDGHSGVRQLTNAAGIVTDQYGYDAYGSGLYSVGGTQNSYQYQGEQSDSNLGMQYLRARYYNQGTGRFASVDPFEGWQEQPVSRHRYFYANGNPIVYEDPSGQMSTMAEVATGLLIAGILGSAVQVTPSYFAMKGGKQEDNVRWFGAGFGLDITKPLLAKSAGLVELSANFGFNLGLRFVSTDYYLSDNPGYEGKNVKQENSLLATFAAVGNLTFSISKGSLPVVATFGTFEVWTPRFLSPEAGFGYTPLSGGYFETGLGMGGFGNLGPASAGLGGARTFLTLGYGIGNGTGYFIGGGQPKGGYGGGASLFLQSGLSLMIRPNIVTR